MLSQIITGDFSASQSMFGWCVVLIAVSIGAVSDLRTGRIPNVLTLPVFFLGLSWAVWIGGIFGAGQALGSAFILALPCLILFLFAGGGAGDVKLLGALGAWLSFHDAVVALVCVAVAGVICGMLYASLRRRSAMLLSNMHRIVGSFALALASRRIRDATALMPDQQSMQPMPYGVAIAIGMWVAAGGRWLWQW